MPGKIIILSALILLPLCLCAQPGIDKLRIQVEKETNTPKKKQLLIALCEEYRISDIDSCYITAKKLFVLSEKSADSLNMSYAELYYAYYFLFTGTPETALKIIEKNIGLLSHNNRPISLLGRFYSLSGFCLMKLNRQKDALDKFYAALKISESTHDKELQFKVMNNIGWAFMELNQFEKAIENLKTAISIIRENHFVDKYGTFYNNLASCYGSIDQIDSTYKYASIGISIARQYGDMTAEANGLNIMGTFLTKQKRYKEALDYFLKAKPIREKIGDPFYIVSDMAVMGDLYAKLGNTKEGLKVCMDALDIAQKEKVDAKVPMIYESLANNYEAAGDYKQMAEVYKKLSALKDTLYEKANPKALAEIQTKYETEKKERIIEQQDNRIRLQNFLFVGAVGLVLLAGLLVYSQYKRYRLRQETKMKTELMKQQELAVKAVIEAEETERQRIAKDLHDGVGQMMSAAKMNLSAFESEIKFNNGEQKQSFENIIQLVDDSCKEVRTVSHIMMPNALLKNNLAAAVKDFVDKLDKKMLQVHVDTEGMDERIESNIETVLYRVIQECVTNVIKHARATTLDISLIRDKDGISVTIEDNGKGFDATDKEKFEGIGLKNIITRIEYLKGTVDFDSAPGRGTVVVIHVPVVEH